MSLAVFSLSIHAHYACRHSGACCTAGWRIPVEPALQPALGTSLLIPGDAGECSHYDRSDGLCRIQRDRGVALLPRSCDQFPRVSLTDDRGTFVTLSHFCPTAALTLFSDTPLAIVEDPVAFPADRFYDALDGRATWPPLVKKDLLFDLSTYSRWESFLVTVLDRRDRTLTQKLDAIAAAAERLRQWTAHDGSFPAFAEAIFRDDEDVDRLRPGIYERYRGQPAYDAVTQLRPELPWPHATAATTSPAIADSEASLDVNTLPPLYEHVVSRYLAAKAFASWCAYQSGGVRTLVAELFVSETVARIEAMRAADRSGRVLDRESLIEAVRAADWLLVHSVDRTMFTDWLGRAEAS